MGRSVIPEQITLVAHADWSINPDKRWYAYTKPEGGGQYLAHAPIKVVHPESLLQQLEEIAGASGCILIGFDFPIGLPYGYTEKAGIADFLAWFAGLEKSEW